MCNLARLTVVAQQQSFETQDFDMQCAQYFPEALGQREAYGGWQVECTSLQEVDSDVSRRALLVTPPGEAGVRASATHMPQPVAACTVMSPAALHQGNHCHQPKACSALFRCKLFGAVCGVR